MTSGAAKNIPNETLMVTGAAGFIGANLVRRLLADYPWLRIVGVDNLSDYYDVELKEYRLASIAECASDRPGSWEFVRMDLADKDAFMNLVSSEQPRIVVNLAAQAGVRYSIDHPDEFISSNILGFYSVLEACRLYPVEHLVFASSSSVYGECAEVPFGESSDTDHPVSLYAATKKCDEVLAHSYSHLYGIPTTGLRFFTVYGPEGRPDMFYYSATRRLIAGEPIGIFNHGNCLRDFTYVDDVVEGLIRVMATPPIAEASASAATASAPFAVYNIGHGSPVNLMEFIGALERALIDEGLVSPDTDFEPLHRYMPAQPGDVTCTFADTEPLKRAVGYEPATSLQDGLRSFVRWYKDYHRLESLAVSEDASRKGRR